MNKYFVSITIALLGLLAGCAHQWTLSTADTRLTLAISNNHPTIAHLQNPTDSHDWIPSNLPIPLMSKVSIDNHEIPLSWTFQSAQNDRSANTITLLFTNTTPNLTLKSIWRARPGHGPIEHHIEITNQSPHRITLTNQQSLTLSSLQTGDPASFWWINRGGSNASTEGGTFTEPLTPSRDITLNSDPTNGSAPVPWLAIQISNQRGLYVGWEFSALGALHAHVSTSPQTLDIDLGNPPNFKTDLDPNQTFQVPPAFVGCYTGDIDDGSYTLHRFILEKLRPRIPANYPDPTLAYNLYLDAGGNHATESDVLRSVSTCHDLGFETFMPDAMWFPSTGDWRWDPARFPRGVTPIEQAVHNAGMKFALWCAWTNGGISSDPGALSIRGPVAHPDWFTSDVPPTWQPAPFSGALLCLASPAAKQWALAKTQSLVQNFHLDYLKHDINPIVTSCSRTDHLHHYGVDTSYYSTRAYYDIQNHLLKSNPSLLLENCSGGGHIKDFGVIQCTHYTVATDTLSNLPDRQSIYDSTFAFPPLLLQAYTYDNAYPVQGDAPANFLWRSGMMSAWQIDPTDTATWTDAQRDSVRRSTQIYKSWIRPILAGAKVHHILPRPDGLHWDGMFYYNSSLRHGMLYIFRPDSPIGEQSIHLKGLDPKQQYWIWAEDASLSPGIHTGQELMNRGLTITLPHPYSSDLIYVQDAALGKPNGLELPGEFHLLTANPTSTLFTASATLSWQPSPSARSYRIRISPSPDFHNPVLDTSVMNPTTTALKLPPNQQLYWKVDAISWAGSRQNSAGPAHFQTPELSPLPGITFLSDMPWVSSTAGAGNTVHRDTAYQDRPISISHHTYEKGIWTHAFPDSTPADLVVNLPNNSYARFAANCGVEDSAGNGTIQFQVLADDHLLAQSPVLHAGDMHPFNLDIHNAKQLTLRVLNGGDGNSCDHAAWGYARLIRAGAPDPIAQLTTDSKR
ncbi:MAG TPA: NPCBM/NEW2 domain-containing protein [Tepidisphaeraceae bacterium]|jgi:alpha-galactosidase|nr:NPCBM/NEW2 domain-containing protein [Tepidisphaeraceae bacterium]